MILLHIQQHPSVLEAVTTTKRWRAAAKKRKGTDSDSTYDCPIFGLTFGRLELQNQATEEHQTWNSECEGYVVSIEDPPTSSNLCVWHQHVRLYLSSEYSLLTLLRSGTQKVLHQCNVDLHIASFPVSQLSQLFSFLAILQDMKSYKKLGGRVLQVINSFKVNKVY